MSQFGTYLFVNIVSLVCSKNYLERRYAFQFYLPRIQHFEKINKKYKCCITSYFIIFNAMYSQPHLKLDGRLTNF